MIVCLTLWVKEEQRTGKEEPQAAALRPTWPAHWEVLCHWFSIEESHVEQKWPGSSTHAMLELPRESVFLPQTWIPTPQVAAAGGCCLLALLVALPFWTQFWEMHLNACLRTCSLPGDYRVLIRTGRMLGRRHVAIVRNLACVPGARQAWIGISALSLTMGP